MDELNHTSARHRSKRKNSPVSIAHGSSDYQRTETNNGNHDSSSFGSFNSVSLEPCEGLHHRHPHRLNDDHNDGSTLFGKRPLPNPPSNSKLTSLKKVHSSPKTRWIRFSFPVLIVGYLVSLYLQSHRYSVDDSVLNEERHQKERFREIMEKGNNGVGKDSAGYVKSGSASSINGGPTKSKLEYNKRKSIKHYSSISRRYLSKDKDIHSQIKSDPNFVPFGFNPKQQSEYLDDEEPPARAQEWAQTHLDNADVIRNRIKQRRQRTSGRSTNTETNLQSIGVVETSTGLLPLWYELNHLTTQTMESLHRRWNKDSSTDSTLDSSSLDEFSLCGSHANTAAKHHPTNYYPTNTTFTSHHSPLGENSRVLITGILSPLGLHLALALSRQCNVSNFIGIDVQMPNDSLGRLEQQERLAVLMEELDEMKSFSLPFLGLQGKQTVKKSVRHEKEIKSREEALMDIYMYGDALQGYSNLPSDYTIPNKKYGIPYSPGINAGSGPLELLLDYRPTHIVHLAGTQYESFTSTKDVDYVYPTQDEEELILEESISNKPHLYELQMGKTGMEQLLSGIVAMSMLPPRYGREEDKGEEQESIKKLSRSDLDKMKRPHLVYASSYDAGYFDTLASRIEKQTDVDGVSSNDLGQSSATQSPPRGLHGVSALNDEILASTYYGLYGVSSVGLRFDSVYGPRGFGVPSTSIPIYNVHRIRRGGVGFDVDLAESAVRRMYRRWVEVVRGEKEEDGMAKKKEGDGVLESSLIEEAGWLHAAHDPRDFVFVEDAVGAIIAAMQYRAVGDSPATFNIGSGEMSTLSSLSEEIEQLSSDSGINDSGKHVSKSVIDVELSSAARYASLDSKEYLKWSSTTSLQDGAAMTLAWHLDRALPFFPPSTSADGPQPLDGEDILSRRGLSSCVPIEDPTCLREAPTYPCSSECSTKTCVPSVFDGVLELSREVTEDCDAVLYTTSLGYNVKKLNLNTQYSDGQEQKNNGDPTLCTIAFVPSESKLVQSVIAKVPPSSLEGMNLGLTEKSDYATKVKKLNGHLVHQGWLLVFVEGATEPLPAPDVYMPKLSPRRLFHPSVRRAMFVDENFTSTPMPEDALFLASEMSRGKIKKRTVTGPNEKGKKIKYKLPEEPPRKCVVMVAPMRNQPKVESHAMPLREITKNMMKEIGLGEDVVESREIHVQRFFYERARGLINSFDMRSLADVARHRLQIKDFIRSRWILHDLKEEEGHQLRCEWYREHVRWNTHLDQLSFAYVMAKRELTRKVITEQPLQTEVEKKTLLQMVIDAKSDAKEWHPIFSGEGTTLPIHHSQIAPEAIPQNLEDQHEITEEAPEETPPDDGSNTFYVRIMSDERMVEARKAWTKARQIRLQANKKQ